MKQGIGVVGVALALLVVLVLAMGGQGGGQALAAPSGVVVTPVAVTARGNAAVLTFWNGQALTASGASAVLDVAELEAADIQYAIDQGTTNTVTVKIQFSNDLANWEDGVTLVTNNAADAALLSQYAVFGRFARLYATVTNSNPVTVTAIGLGK